MFVIEGETGCGWYSFVTVDEKRWLLYCGSSHYSSSSSSASLSHALLVMPGCRRRCKRVKPHFSTAAPADRLEHVITVFISLLLRFLSSCACVCVCLVPSQLHSQPTQRRQQIGLQHFTANQIQDQLHRGRQVLLAIRAGMSVQMSPHRHHLPRLFTGRCFNIQPSNNCIKPGMAI